MSANRRAAWVICLLLSSSVIPSAAALPNDPPYVVGDEFNTGDYDHSIWAPPSESSRWCPREGRWRAVKTEYCYLYTQPPPYGTVNVHDGVISFAASSNTRAYPYLWTQDGVLSDSGDFVIDVRMRYVSLLPHGDGLFAKRWPDPTPTGTNSPYGVGTTQCSTFGVWGDAGSGVTLYFMGDVISVPGIATAFHDYRFQYAGGKYFIFVDGHRLVGPVQSTVEPNRLWLGNPAFIDGLGTADWSDFDVDYVRLSEPTFIDSDGDGVHDGTQSWTPPPTGSPGDSDGDGLPNNCDPSPGQGDAGPVLPTEQTFGSGSGLHAEDPSGEFADPINMATGAFVSSVTDLAMPGTGVPFVLTRSYTSADSATGPLGQGWTHSYAPVLSTGMGGNVTLRGEDGQRVTYTRAADGSYSGGPGARSRLSEVSGGGYEVVRKDQVRYRFSAAGRLTSMVDRNGQGLTFAYDGSGRLATATDSAGRVVTFTHNGAGLLTDVELPDSRSVSYGYTGGRLTSVTDLRGGTTTYAYDASGRLESAVDQNGHRVFLNTYGADGRVTDQLDARNNNTHFDWNASTQTATATDPRGHEWKHVFKNNVLVKEIDPLGKTTTYTTDDDLNRTAVTDPRGNKTTFGFDGRGNVLRITAPAALGYRQTFVYDTKNNVVRSTDGRSQTTAYEYDAAGNLVEQTEADPDGPGPETAPVTTYGRESGTGRLTSIEDGRGKTTALAYDADGNLASVTTPLGFVTTMDHDDTGRLTGRVDPRGNVTGADPDDFRTTFGYDDSDHVVSTTDPLGHATSLEYDAVGNLTERTDANNHATGYGYDSTNRLLTVTAPDQTMTTYAYDAAGNLILRTDAKNHGTTYTYDDANRLTTVTTPLGKQWMYSRNANGDVSSVVDANGNSTPLDPADGKTTFGYDELGRLTTIDYSDSTPDVGLAYDANGNRTSMTDGAGTVEYVHDDLDRLKSVTRGSDVFAYGYDEVGNVTGRTYPDGTLIAYAFDDDGRLQSVTSDGATTSYGYDAAANLTSTTLPASTNITETRAYDEAGRLEELVNARGGTVLSSFGYTLDPVGNPTEIDTAAGTRTFGYDSLDRLTEVCYQQSCPDPADPYIRWAYDAVGNRQTETRPAGTTTYDYDADDRLTSTTGLGGSVSFGYDENGNETSAGAASFTYSLAGRTHSATVGGTTTDYSYDGDGTRLQSANGSSTTNHVWDPNSGLPQLALERDGSGALRRRYLYGASTLSFTPGTSGSPSYFTVDGLGSVVGVYSYTGTDQWTYDYEPFGAERTTTQLDANAPTNPLQFTGQPIDPGTDLYHLRARQYDPRIGRFTATDPVSTPLTEPYRASYVYAADRPGVLIDPSGQFGVFGAVVGAVIGGVAGGTQAAATGGGWKEVLIGAGAGAATGAVVGGFPFLAGIRAAAILGGVADLAAQTATQVSSCGSVGFRNYNWGSVVGSSVGGAIGAGLGLKAASESAQAFSERAAVLIGAGSGFVPGLTPSIGGGLLGQAGTVRCGTVTK